MRQARVTEKGTTLLEMAAVLVILGMVAAGATAMLTNAAEGMINSRNASTSAEEIQAAFTRITHEITNADTKRGYDFTGNSISYYYRNSAAQTTIQLSGTNLLLDGNILLNNVQSNTGFSVTPPNYGVTPGVPVRVTLIVNVPMVTGVVQKTYSTRIEVITQRFQ